MFEGGGCGTSSDSYSSMRREKYSLSENSLRSKIYSIKCDSITSCETLHISFIIAGAANSIQFCLLLFKMLLKLK